MESIKFLDIGYLYQKHKQELDDAYFRVMNSAKYILGPETLLFEEEFAAYCGAKYGVGLANGLDAISIALKALGVKEGDEVIVPSFTFIATWLAVSNIGAKPVIVDIDYSTFNIDASKIEEKITDKTKAVIAVYLYGQPAEIDTIRNICKRRKLAFIADAAQAHGAKYKGSKIGELADVTCYSFYPGKNLGAFGDGGAVVTNNHDLYNSICQIRNYGSSVKYHHDVLGVNSRLDELQAAFLRVKLRYLDGWNDIRKKQADIYKSVLNKEYVTWQIAQNDMESVYHLFVIATNARDSLQNYLFSKGIETIIHYPISLNKAGAYSHCKIDNKDCHVAEVVSSKVLSLPLGPHLSLEDINKVAMEVNNFFKDR